MTLGVYFGRFQPFHKEHLETILKLKSKVDNLIIFIIYNEKNKKEILTPKNPIPINYRVEYIKSILNDYIETNNYYIVPINIYDRNFLFEIYRIFESFNDKEIIIYTRDIKRFVVYEIFSALSKIFSYKIRIIYDKNKNISSKIIRQAIREEKYDEIKHFLPKDLDKIVIEHIKRFKKERKEIDDVLKLFFYII